MKQLLIAACLLTFACGPEQPASHHEVPTNGKPLQIKNTIPNPGEMQAANDTELTHMLAQHVMEQQNIELLYIEKVYPAVRAVMERGLIKGNDVKLMISYNNYVNSELDKMVVAGKQYRQKKDQESFSAWQLHHDNAYRVMGQMLELTGQLKYYKEPPRKARPEDVQDAKRIAQSIRSGQ